MKNLVLGSLVAFAVLGCATPSGSAKSPATAQSDQVVLAQADGTPAAKDKKKKRICHRSRVVGTHLYREVCRTQEEADGERDRTQNQFLRPQVKEGPLGN